MLMTIKMEDYIFLQLMMSSMWCVSSVPALPDLGSNKCTDMKFCWLEELPLSNPMSEFCFSSKAYPDLAEEEAHSCSLACKDLQPLGIGNRKKILDDQITACDSLPSFSAHCARLNLSPNTTITPGCSGHGWAHQRHKDRDSFLQVDFQSPSQVSALRVQADEAGRSLLTFYLMYRNSSDRAWLKVSGMSNATFYLHIPRQKMTRPHATALIYLPRPLVARYLRIYPSSPRPHYPAYSSQMAQVRIELYSAPCASTPAATSSGRKIIALLILLSGIILVVSIAVFAVRRCREKRRRERYVNASRSLALQRLSNSLALHRLANRTTYNYIGFEDF